MVRTWCDTFSMFCSISKNAALAKWNLLDGVTKSFYRYKQNWLFLSSYEARHKNIYGIITCNHSLSKCEMMRCINITTWKMPGKYYIITSRIIPRQSIHWRKIVEVRSSYVEAHCRASKKLSFDAILVISIFFHNVFCWFGSYFSKWISYLNQFKPNNYPKKYG